MRDLTFDEEGRPDFETVDALDVDRAAEDISKIIAGKKVIPPVFDFNTRRPMEGDESRAIQLPDDGMLVVEGLHGLNDRISGHISDEVSTKLFIVPFGNVFHDSKLMDKREIRLLRRIVRDNRHRAAHALSTIDYWPMIEQSEKIYFKQYLAKATYHVNSFLAYEPLIIAPMALQDIKKALEDAADGDIAPNVFMEKSNTGKPFANLEKAIEDAGRLLRHLNEIPVIDPSRVPEASILNEFISS